MTDRIPVYALYVDPPLGRVGLTEAEAKAKGHAVRVGKRPMTRVARAVEKGETQGFMKVVVDGQSDAILGAAILGPGGDEAIHGVIEAMAAGVTATAYTRVVPSTRQCPNSCRRCSGSCRRKPSDTPVDLRSGYVGPLPS